VWTAAASTAVRRLRARTIATTTNTATAPKVARMAARIQEAAAGQDFNPERYASLHVADDQTDEVLAQIAWMLKSGNRLSPLAGVYPVSRIVMAGPRLSELTAQGWWPAEYTARYGAADADRLGAYVRAALDESPDGQAIAVTVPEGAGRFTWNIDGSNGLVDLGTAGDEGDHWRAIGSINPIRVSDTRSTGQEWSVSAQVSDFTSNGSRVDAKFLGWAPKLSQNTGGALAGAAVASGFDGGSGLGDPALLGSAPRGHAPGSVLLGADLELKLPADVDPGTYSARLTLTALS